MTSLLITTFCLGFSIGAIYTYVVTRIVEHKYKKKNTMKKFEYYSFTIDSIDDADRTLDELGEGGWEAYAVANSRIYLKREKP